MLKGKNIDFSYSKDKTFIKNLNIDKKIIDLNNIDNYNTWSKWKW